jgi:hypothetical protein
VRKRKARFLNEDPLSPASRALPFYYNDPGVPLGSTPGFMLSPALRADCRFWYQELHAWLKSIWGTRRRLSMEDCEWDSVTFFCWPIGPSW